MNKARIAVASIVYGDVYPPGGNYSHAVEIAGGQPLFVGVLNANEAECVADEFDALLLTGGGDANAHLFEQVLHQMAEPVPLERDTTEIHLAKAFLKANKPILAICRGEQILNVALGGDLIQHVFDDEKVTIAHQNKETRHSVNVVPGTLLHSIFGGLDSLTVNSTHHQAVGRLAQGLTVNAISPDGLVEAYSMGDTVLATQWHPEKLVRDGMMPIWEWFIQLASKETQGEAWL